MKIPSEFDPIRPFEPEELPAVYDRILADKQFQMVLAYLYPDVPAEAIAKRCTLVRRILNSKKHSAILPPASCHGVELRL